MTLKDILVLSKKEVLLGSIQNKLIKPTARKLLKNFNDVLKYLLNLNFKDIKWKHSEIKSFSPSFGSRNLGVNARSQ